MADTSLRPFITGIRLTFLQGIFVHVIWWLPMEGNSVKDNKTVTINFYFVVCLTSHF